jgi:hypothetical protein
MHPTTCALPCSKRIQGAPCSLLLADHARANVLSSVLTFSSHTMIHSERMHLHTLHNHCHRHHPPPPLSAHLTNLPLVSPSLPPTVRLGLARLAQGRSVENLLISIMSLVCVAHLPLFCMCSVSLICLCSVSGLCVAHVSLS